MGFKPLETE